MQSSSVLLAFLIVLASPVTFASASPLVITDVTVIPADTDDVLAHRTVTIAGAHIVRIEPASRAQWLPSANRYLSAAFRQRDRATLFSASYDFARVLTRQLWKKGVILTVGTDARLPGVIYGYSVHQEMIELGEIGLSPMLVLRAATVNSHRLVDPGGASGAVRVGQRVDPVLLDADPLSDIQNMSQISGVIVNERWLSSAQIDQLLNFYQAAV
ncbi:amidohydrolase family protein [Undibacterium sp. Di26W]|uniref:amidohydrolase family protein n=1 Tax=Undibacterium sp. Di26W TaxID=3413035 RepID=UPI003BF04C28